MEKMPFHQLLAFAWRLSLRSRILWFFGLFLALSPLLTSFIFSHFFPKLTAENWQDLLGASSNNRFLLISLLLGLVFLIKVFGKSSLILSIPMALSQAKMPYNLKALNPLKLLRGWKRTLALEIVIFFFLFFLAVILSTPVVFSHFYKPAAFDTLIFFSGASFFVLFLLVFFVKELALFYLLLSELSLRASLENAYSLFIRSFSRCLAFGAYVGAVFLLFTFCLDLFILTFGELLRLPSLATFGISAFFLTWFSVLYRALWFFFFRDLATPPVPLEKITEKKVLLDEKIPEIPSV